MRLTKKDYFPLELDDELSKIYNKLGHFEDLEEKLGINLDVFVHAMFKGIYFKKDNDIKFVSCILPSTTQFLGILGFFDFDDPKIIDKEPHYCFHKEYDYWLFEDYGKTWALTKEELENG